MWNIPTKAALVAADADGPFELVAFDNALRKAGIAELNLVTLSSIWPLGCKIVKMPRPEPGMLTPMVIAKISSSTTGQKIAAALGIAISETSHGMISEYHDIGISQKNCRSDGRSHGQIHDGEAWPRTDEGDFDLSWPHRQKSWSSASSCRVSTLATPLHPFLPQGRQLEVRFPFSSRLRHRLCAKSSQPPRSLILWLESLSAEAL